MKKIVLLIIILNVSLAAAQLVLALGRSADGISISKLRLAHDQLVAQNQLLGEEVFTKSSLPYIASHASASGLTGGQVRFVTGQVPVAARLSP